MAPAELRVDTGVLANEGNGLLRAAEEIPAAPEPFTAVGADPLSEALSARVQAAVAPLISGLPKTKADAAKTAGQVVAAADRYETTDKQLADEITKRLQQMPQPGSGAPSGGAAPAVGAGGGAGAPGAPAAAGDAPGAPAGVDALSAADPVGAGSGAADQLGQLGDMMGTPVDMATQAAQAPMGMAGMAGMVPGAIMQGAQAAMQQGGQVSQVGATSPADQPGHDDGEEVLADAAGPASQPSQPAGAAPGAPGERAPEAPSAQRPAGEPVPPGGAPGSRDGRPPEGYRVL
ncbi:hypothetical protein MSM1_06675 [Mycobacterium sp. SM1]|uniref:hypothetical protein n=1 Tax=Mycobacterium sp. SM1 TaxID=2816243 RepID=UPI001BCFD117|nr:hypothetical protein [Mycobacterium sp. SM1]MBS4728047.1 hypothetical protein [Mycobacterium sp. SM1]